MSATKPVFIIAEAGVNHNGSVDMAVELIDVAVRAGADAVKFQTFKAEKMIGVQALKAEYQTAATDNKESQLEMVRKLELDEAAHRLLIQHCKTKSIQFLSSPFDRESLFMLVHTFNLPMLKLPSGEITNAPLLLEAAGTGRLVLLSTGMSTLGEVEAALGVLAYGYTRPGRGPSLDSFREAFSSEDGRRALQKNVTLLHCTTEYPAPFAEVNLLAMDTLRSAFGLPVGFSDHTAGISIPVAAVARGATIIEKHFTIDRELPGPDHRASLEPDELRSMVLSIRQVEMALGASTKGPTPSEFKNIQVVRKSLVAAARINKGEVFTEENITFKRPGNGVSPFYYWDLLGRKANRDYEQDEVVAI
jgi:N-acetylneuraminate synthase